LQNLAALGFKISIDDFGTGYSLLACLHRFPFDTLKIDRSFVARLASGREAVEIVRIIVGLALALDKPALAEGVEEPAQAPLLREVGVHVGQVWLFGMALPVDQAQQTGTRLHQASSLISSACSRQMRLSAADPGCSMPSAHDAEGCVAPARASKTGTPASWRTRVTRAPSMS